MSSRGIQKLFVSNLPWTVGHRQLKSYFSEFGRVLSGKFLCTLKNLTFGLLLIIIHFLASVVFDKKTGLSKNYGFVVVEKSALPLLEKVPKHKLENSFIFYQSSE